MRIAIFKGIFIIILFLVLWFLLNKIDWVNVLKIDTVTTQTEEKLGDIFWDLIKQSENENNDSTITNCVDSIVNSICYANDLDRLSLKIHILNKDEVNALSLTNGHLIIYTGLINKCENPEELSGIIGHEIAHIQLNHISKKLIKEVGLSAIISITTGSSSSTAIKEILKTFTSTAFDRNLEKEADLKAVDYLINAQVNPEHFANFLYKFSENESDNLKYLEWVNTHPNSKERAEYIINYSKGKMLNNTTTLVSSITWQHVKVLLNTN